MKILSIFKEIKNNKLLGSSITMSVISSVLVITIIAFMNKSAGWFTKQVKVEATGMSVIVESSASLTISHVTDGELTPGSGSDKITQNMNSNPLTATMIDGELKYVANVEDVDPATGEVEAPDYQPAVAGLHYQDARAAITTVGNDFGQSKLKIKISGFGINSTTFDGTDSLLEKGSRYYYMNSVTVEVYYSMDKAQLGTHCGTLTMSDRTTVLTTGAVNIVQGTPIYLTLRCYYDGVKKDSENTIYMSTAGLLDDMSNKKLSSLSFNVYIEAVPASEG